MFELETQKYFLIFASFMLNIHMQPTNDAKNNPTEKSEECLNIEMKIFCQGRLLIIRNEGKSENFSLCLNGSIIDFCSTALTQLIIENHSDEFTETTHTCKNINMNENHLKGILCMLECLQCVKHFE